MNEKVEKMNAGEAGVVDCWTILSCLRPESKAGSAFSLPALISS
jgi:hypothetical protein